MSIDATVVAIAGCLSDSWMTAAALPLACPTVSITCERPPDNPHRYLDSEGCTRLGPTTYAAPRSALAIHSGSTIRGVGTAGSNPLAPTTYPFNTGVGNGVIFVPKSRFRGPR